MPDHGLGVAVQVNCDGPGAVIVDAVAAAIYDCLRERRDARERVVSRLEAIRARAGAAAAPATSAAARPLPLPLAAYTGVFADDRYGTIEIREESGALVARMGVARSPVEVVDGAKGELRVALLGVPVPLAVAAPAGDGARAASLSFLGATFTRRD
jgi:hypothetical protein